MGDSVLRPNGNGVSRAQGMLTNVNIFFSSYICFFFQTGQER